MQKENFSRVCWKHAHLKTLVPLLLFSPAIELNPIGQFGELVRQAALLYDALGANRHLTQGEGLGRRNQAKFVDSVGDHILGRGVLADDDVAALLVSLEHSNDLVWDVWEMKRRQEESPQWRTDLYELEVAGFGSRYRPRCQKCR